MSRKSMARAAQGSGSIRKKSTVSKGKRYTYWEARITTGYNAGTGRQIQRSITGKTQKEVREKLQEIAVELNSGTYLEPTKLTVGQWIDTWRTTYLTNVKPRTLTAYESDIRLHIKPALGAVRLDALTTHEIQRFYNDLSADHGEKKGLSAKTIRTIHGILHHALKQAVANGLIRSNPAAACTLPRIVKKEIRPLDEEEIKRFLAAIVGNRFEVIYRTTIFTGLREGEILGLTWDCVDFQRGTLNINKQMQLHQEKGMEAYQLTSPKNGKGRIVAAAPSVLRSLKQYRAKQAQWKLLVKNAWGNSDDLVFTDEMGNHLTKSAVYRTFKTIAASIGRPDLRFHDLRHSYAVAAIRSGDDIKTVQSNLGHATAAFTLDVYGHVTDQMKQDSAARMEKFIEKVSGE